MRRSRLVTVLVGVAAVALIGAVVGVAGVTAAADRSGETSAAAPTASATPNPLDAGGLQDPARGAEMTEASDATPTRVRIPSIGVDSSLEMLGIGAAGELVAPVDYDLAGWFDQGPVPGRIGPAIIAGHVDSPSGPAVFLRIGELAVGSDVFVDLSDGTTVTFAVTGSQQSPKAQFPTSDVYDNVPRPELRLITCTGTFDDSIGHYTDNLIVYAALKT